MKTMSVNFADTGALVDLSIAPPSKLRAAFSERAAAKQGLFARIWAWLGR